MSLALIIGIRIFVSSSCACFMCFHFLTPIIKYLKRYYWVNIYGFTNWWLLFIHEFPEFTIPFLCGHGTKSVVFLCCAYYVFTCRFEFLVIWPLSGMKEWDKWKSWLPYTGKFSTSEKHWQFLEKKNIFKVFLDPFRNGTDKIPKISRIKFLEPLSCCFWQDKGQRMAPTPR